MQLNVWNNVIIEWNMSQVLHILARLHFNQISRMKTYMTPRTM